MGDAKRKREQMKQNASRTFRVIKDDPLADAIWQFWSDIGSRERYVPGSLNSSYHLAQYLREKGFAPKLAETPEEEINT
jgi:hypothetical protein